MGFVMCLGSLVHVAKVAVHPEYLDDAYEGELLVLFVDLLGVPLDNEGIAPLGIFVRISAKGPKIGDNTHNSWFCLVRTLASFCFPYDPSMVFKCI